MSNSRLDAEVLKGTRWEQSEISLRVRLFEGALTSQPSRGTQAGSKGIDVVTLAEARWPGTLAVYEHPLWPCWKEPPQTFSSIVQAVEDSLQFLKLKRNLVVVGGLGLLPTSGEEQQEVLHDFKISVANEAGRLSVLDRLLLTTVLFREADVLRLPTVAFLMDSLCRAIVDFVASDLGDQESVDEIETALLFARWEIAIDDPSTISNSLDGLAPIIQCRLDT